MGDGKEEGEEEKKSEQFKQVKETVTHAKENCEWISSLI